MDLPAPPAELHYLHTIIGAEALLALIEARGGLDLYIPANPKPSCVLATVIGIHAAMLLSGMFGGETIRIPLCRHWRVKIYRQRGMSVTQIARKLGVGENTIYRLNYLHKSASDQPDLFGNQE